jgi:hypothetical protein
LLITTTAGKQVSGIKTRESATELVLRTPDDKEITIAVKDIDEKAQGSSLMPEGLTDAMTRAELIDLVRFLSELGKIGPYAASKARLVRRWEYLEDSQETRDAIDKDPASVVKDAGNLTWSPIYSSVGGVVGLGELPRIEIGNRRGAYAVVRFQVDVSTAGAVQLKAGSTTGLTLFVNKTQVPLKETTTLNLPAGLQTLTVLVDLYKRHEGLRLEIDDEPGSPARVRVVGGK